MTALARALSMAIIVILGVARSDCGVVQALLPQQSVADLAAAIAKHLAAIPRA